jgi:hypothetical protein
MARLVGALLLCFLCVVSTIFAAAKDVINVHVVGHSHDDPGKEVKSNGVLFFLC